MSRLIESHDMRITQTFSSGIIIVRQDFRDAVRFVVFDTGLEEWQTTVTKMMKSHRCFRAPVAFGETGVIFI